MTLSNSFTRRRFLALAGVSAMTGVLAACVVPETAPGDMASAEPILLRYGRHDPGGGVEVTLDAFHEEHPNLEVQIEVIGEFHAKVHSMAAAGNLPDIVRSWEAMVLDLGRNNQFIDIQSYVDSQADFDADDFYSNWWDYPVEAGKRFGLPDAVATHMTFYNKDLFDANGVEYPDPASFTWDDFEAKARGISDPEARIWGSETIPVGWHMFSVKQVWQNSGSFYSDDYRSCTIGDTPAVEALQRWADMLLDGGVMPSPSQIVGIGGAGAAAELLTAGQIGMQRMGTWITGGLIAAGFTFGIAPEPHSTEQATIAHGAFNAISNGSDHKDEAWTWVNYNSSTQGIYNYCSQANFPGARRSTNLIEPFPWVAPEIEYEVDWDLIPQSLEYGRILPGPANEGESLKLIGDALEQIYAGDAQAADILPEVAEKVTAVISDV